MNTNITNSKIKIDLKGLIVALSFALTTIVAASAAPVQDPNPYNSQPSYAPLLNSNNPNNPNFVDPMPAPPIGSGTTPAGEITGDTGNSPTLTTGQADQTSGTNFPTMNGSDRSTVYVYETTARGRRMVMTLRGDAMTAAQSGQIGGILGISMTSGQQAVYADATANQLYQINQVLAPSADNTGNDTTGAPTTPDGSRAGSTQIQQDPTTAEWQNSMMRPGDSNRYVYGGPLPFVPVFGRYLIILGVVFATVKISLAAYAMVMGHPYAGSRAIAAASGLLMLMASYTIYKIVIMNTTHSNSTTVTNQSFQSTGQVTPTSGPDTPVVPAAPTGYQARQPMPVQPLYAH